MTTVIDADLDRFRFRKIHPSLFVGTASDRYAGWIGQIYTESLYKGRITKRSHVVGDRTYQERVLPVDSVREYFQHFRVLEIDYTFYRPLVDEQGKPTQTYRLLKRYADRLNDEDRLLLKVPQMVFAQKIRRAGRYEENPSYLDPVIFYERFYGPADDLLGANLKGFIFEQEYQRSRERGPAEKLAEDLDRFFAALPEDDRYHVELRTDSYLAAPVFEVLQRRGVGHVLSHWTWLPPLWKQFIKSGRRFFNSGRQLIIRLMTPRGTRYEEAYERAHPFDRLIEEMVQPKMIEETGKLMWEGIHQGVEVNVIINNRAGGNAPLVARRVAKAFLAMRPDAQPE